MAGKRLVAGYRSKSGKSRRSHLDRRWPLNVTGQGISEYVRPIECPAWACMSLLALSGTPDRLRASAPCTEAETVGCNAATRKPHAVGQERSPRSVNWPSTGARCACQGRAAPSAARAALHTCKRSRTIPKTERRTVGTCCRAGASIGHPAAADRTRQCFPRVRSALRGIDPCDAAAECPALIGAPSHDAGQAA